MISLFFFTFSFLLIAGILYYFLLYDKRTQRRISYYLNIEKKPKKLRSKKEQVRACSSGLKKINNLLREKISGRNQDKIEQMLKGAGVNLNPEEYVMLNWLLAAVTGGILYFLSGRLLLAVPFGIFGYIFPRAWIKRKIRLRIQKFNEGLPDMITTTIGSLRSGYSFSQALRTVVEECEPPVRDEISFLLTEMNYGVSMEDALNNLNQRMPSGDLELMIQAILIQRQVGGNLAEVLDIIVKTIRERTKIQRQVHALTSQGRLSGRIIGALPIVLGFAIFLINPSYINTLFTNRIGIIIMSAGVISGVIGFILINKLTKIEV